MTRLMGDATSSQASALPHGLDLVAGYDTGTADIRWTAATWGRFPGIPHVHIDQGGPGAPVYSANVIDVETFAWSPADVPGWIARCTAPVPTVYCNRSTLPAVLATGWRGPVWLAFPGWQPGQPLPPLPAGCRYVAVQNDFQTLYDLSVVLDPNWPSPNPDPEALMQVASYADGRQIAVLGGADGNVYVTEQSAAGSGWTKTGPVGGAVPIPGGVEIAMTVTLNTPGIYISSKDPVATDNGEVWVTWKLPDGTWAAWARIA